MSELLPCPACGSEIVSNIAFGASTLDCTNINCIFMGCLLVNGPYVDKIESRWKNSHYANEITKLKKVIEIYKAAYEAAKGYIDESLADPDHFQTQYIQWKRYQGAQKAVEELLK